MTYAKVTICGLDENSLEIEGVDKPVGIIDRVFFNPCCGYHDARHPSYSIIVEGVEGSIPVEEVRGQLLAGIREIRGFWAARRETRG